MALVSFSEWSLSKTPERTGDVVLGVPTQVDFVSVGLRGGPGHRALVSLFGFRLPGDSNAPSVLGTIELELYLSNLREHEASVGPESMVLIQ